MGGFFTHKDGRLKTGRTAALVFCLFLLAVSLAFQVNKSVKEPLLNVKHIFEAERPPAPAPEKEREKEPNQPRKQTVENEMKHAAVTAAEPQAAEKTETQDTPE